MFKNTQVKINFVGEAGVNPRLVRLITENTIAEVVANNYLKQLKQDGYDFLDSDFIFCSCSDGKILGSISVSGEDIDITQIAPAP